MPGEDDTQRAIGRLEGAFHALSAMVEKDQRAASDFRTELLSKLDASHLTIEQHTRSDTLQFAAIDAKLMTVIAIVDRIKKPVETFISLRNAFVGLAAVLAALGLTLSGAFTAVWAWIAGFAHN